MLGTELNETPATLFLGIEGQLKANNRPSRKVEHAASIDNSLRVELNRLRWEHVAKAAVFGVVHLSREGLPAPWYVRRTCLLTSRCMNRYHKPLLLRQDQFVTVGDDGTVRMWSNGDKRVMRAFNIG